MHTQHMPHIMIVNQLEANKERFRTEGFDQIRPHSIRSLQFDQKGRPLSFRPEKINQFAATRGISSFLEFHSNFKNRKTQIYLKRKSRHVLAPWIRTAIGSFYKQILNRL